MSNELIEPIKKSSGSGSPHSRAQTFCDQSSSSTVYYWFQVLLETYQRLIATGMVVSRREVEGSSLDSVFHTFAWERAPGHRWLSLMLIGEEHSLS